jgi:CDP-4-dehydro-6-deoxyglucose reductase, E1
VFSGNILRQPGYTNLPHRMFGTMEQSDRVMRDTFFIGVYPGLTEDHLAFMVRRFREFFAQRSRWT